MASANDYAAIYQEAGKAFNVDPNLLRAVVHVESGGNPNAVSEVGAQGPAQLMPATAKSLGVKNAFDPRENIFGAAKLLDENLTRYGNANDAILAYHGGTDQKNWGAKTRDYLEKVTSAYQGNQGTKMPSTTNTLGEMNAPDAFSSYFSGETKAAPKQADAFTAYFGSPGEAKATPIAQAQTQAKTPQQSGSTLDELGRQIGLTARAGITGAAALPNMVGDALNSALNYGIRGINSAYNSVTSPSLSELVTGRKPLIPELQMPSQVTQQALNAAGLPQPKNATERVVQNVASSMASVAPNVALGKALAGSSAPVISAVGQGLMQAPGAQVAGAAGSAAGGGAAFEAGLSPAAQIGATLAGGLGGALTPMAPGSAARGVAGAAGQVGSAVQPLLRPEKYVGRQLAQQLGAEKSAQIAANIRAAQEFVPGSLPTTAQAGANPTLVATEKALANISPEFKIALAERGVANNEARWAQLMSVAKTPEELAAAIQARSEAAAPLYEAAHAGTANVGKAFVEFARRPAVTQAMREADLLAKNEGVQLKWPTPNDREINGQALDYTSRALSNMIDKAQRSGANQEVRALTQAKDYLQNWTNRYIPEVRAASAEYATQSIPVNTMEAAQQIANNLGTRAMGASGIADLQLNPYRTALASALKGQKYGIEEGALQRLQGIGQDLQRATISNSLRSPGSDTAYNIAANGWLARQLYGPEFEGAGLGARGIGALAAMATGNPVAAGAVIAGGKKAGEAVGTRLNKQLGNLLMNPESLLPYLDAQAKLTGRLPPEAIAEALRRNASSGLVGAAGSQKPSK